MFLQDQGFSRSDIIRVILISPDLMTSGLESAISPAIKTLREIMGSDASVISVIKKLNRQEFPYQVKRLMPNIALLRNNGIPIEAIRKQLLRQPNLLFRKPEACKSDLIRVENKFGIPRDSPRYLRSILILSQYSDATIESKCRVFKSFGWTQSQVETVLVKYTPCLLLSEATIKKKLDFLMNEVGLSPADLASHAVLLTCSRERRVVPRHKVLLFLKEKGSVKKNYSFYTAMCISELCLLKMFVLPFKEVHEVYARHTGCDLKILTQGSAENLP